MGVSGSLGPTGYATTPRRIRHDDLGNSTTHTLRPWSASGDSNSTRLQVVVVSYRRSNQSWQLTAGRCTMEQIQRILIEASTAIKQLTNEMDPNCPLCGGTTEADGRGHLDCCIVKRCVAAAFALQGQGGSRSEGTR